MRLLDWTELAGSNKSVSHVILGDWAILTAEASNSPESAERTSQDTVVVMSMVKIGAST